MAGLLREGLRPRTRKGQQEFAATTKTAGANRESGVGFLKECLQGVHGPDGIWNFGDALHSFSETLVQLPPDVQHKPLFSLTDVQDILLACQTGLKSVAKRRFCLDGAVAAELLKYHTSAGGVEEFNDMFLHPLKEFYETIRSICREMGPRLRTGCFGRSP